MFVQSLQPYWDDLNPRIVTIANPNSIIDTLLPFPHSMLEVLAAASEEAMMFGARPLTNYYSHNTEDPPAYHHMSSVSSFQTHSNLHQQTFEPFLDLNTRQQSVAPFSQQRVHAFQPSNAFYSFTPYGMTRV